MGAGATAELSPGWVEGFLVWPRLGRGRNQLRPSTTPALHQQIVRRPADWGREKKRFAKILPFLVFKKNKDEATMRKAARWGWRVVLWTGTSQLVLDLSPTWGFIHRYTIHRYIQVIKTWWCPPYLPPIAASHWPSFSIAPPTSTFLTFQLVRWY